MNEDIYASDLTDEELEDFQKIVCTTIDALIQCADKHNIDRDDFVKYFAEIFYTMCEVSTFERYGEGVAMA